MTICFYQCLLREIPSQRRVLADQVPELLVVQLHHLYKCRLQTRVKTLWSKLTHHTRSRLDFGSESRNPLVIEKPRSNEIGSSLKINIYMAPPRSVGVEQRVGLGLRQVQVAEAALLLGLAVTLISG